MSFTSRLISLAAAGAGSESYWYNKLSNVEDRQGPVYWIDYSSVQNVFIGGYYHISNGYNRVDIMEFDADGNYTRGIRNGSGTQDQTTGFSGVVGSDDTVIAGGVDYSAGNDAAYFRRYETSNSWIYRNEQDSGVTSRVNGMYRIGSYIYSQEWREVSGGDSEIVVARGTSDSHDSKSRFFLNDAGEGFNVNSDQRSDITADSNGEMIITADGDDNNNIYFYLASISSSGSTNFKHRYSRNGQLGEVRVICDSNNNIYVIGGFSSGNTGVHLMKFNSSGTFDFQKRYYSSANSTNSYDLMGVDIDADDNIYIMVNTTDEPSTNNYIHYMDYIKVDVSGTLQDGCRFQPNSSSVNPQYSDPKHCLKVDDNGNMWTTFNYKTSSDNEHRHRVASKFNMGLAQQNLGDFTYYPTSRVDSSDSSNYLNTGSKNTNPNLEAVSDSRSVTSRGAGYTSEDININTHVTESVTSL